ncbi:hypothetical protein ACFVYE_32220 [Streptomyces sp. NPDC058239]|uniref:hypothetical protein n=1 Tax=Streptomyces sp. NPDC058239 TaxID=3346395 RepID=UPI0036E8C042
MTTWLAYAAFLIYLAGIGALAQLLGHFWDELRAEDPRLDLMATTQPALAPLLMTLVIIAWPVTIPIAIVDNTNSGDLS